MLFTFFHGIHVPTVDFIRQTGPPLQRQRDGQVLKEKRSADGIEQEAKKGLIKPDVNIQ